MPPIGLINLKGEKVPYSEIAPNYRYEDWKQPLPKLVIFSRGKRVYSGSDVFASATQLVAPPRIFWLERRLKWYEYLKDQVPTYLGQKTHLLFEQSAEFLKRYGWLTEVPYYIPLDVDGETVHIGFMPDCVDLNTGTLHDYKITKSWKVKKALKRDEWLNWPKGSCSDWTIQQSIYAWGLSRKDKVKITIDELDENSRPVHEVDPEPIVVDKAYLDATVKDWTPHRKDLEPTHSFEVPLMSFKETEDWVVKRVRYLKSFENATSFDDCSDDEIWISGKYEAEIKSVNGNSYLNDETFEGLKEKVREDLKKKGDKNASISITKPVPKRCQKFCPISMLGECDQFKRDYPGQAKVVQQKYELGKK